MSITAVNSESQHDVALLQNLLHKREYHLAELIDEVVFAEQERFKAVQEAHSVRELATHLESAFDKLLEYHITMHKEVLLPTLVASMDGDGVNSRRTSESHLGNIGKQTCQCNGDNERADTATPSNDFLNDLLTEPQLSHETKQLLQTVMQERRSRSAAAAPARPFLSPSSPSPPYDPRNGFDGNGRSPVDTKDLVQHITRRAVILSDSLLQNQETLTRLLRSIQDQAQAMLDRWSHDGGTGTSVPRATAATRSDPNVVLTPSPHSAAASQRRHSVVTPVAPFRLDNLHQHSERAREIEKALRSVEAERDALQHQLLEGRSTSQEAKAGSKTEAAALASEKEAWGKERVQLKQELAYAQQRALEEQAKCRDLKKQVTQLERLAATSPIAAPPQTSKSTSCERCEKMRSELKKKVADYHAAKALWKTEEQRLRTEIELLKREARDTEAKSIAAAATISALKKERTLAAPTSAVAVKTATTTTEAPRYPAGPSSEWKIGQLEATVAAMKADLQIMEMRLSIVQDEREAERRRIFAAHEQERERLRRERDECQKIINKMSRELQELTCTNPGIPAITSTSF